MGSFHDDGDDEDEDEEDDGDSHIQWCIYKAPGIYYNSGCSYYEANIAQRCQSAIVYSLLILWVNVMVIGGVLVHFRICHGNV